MEKPSKHGAISRKDSGGGKAPGDGSPASSPRSKLKDKTTQSGSGERRYKEMLHATSHIYQPQAAIDLTDTPEESRVLNQNAQLHSKDTVPVRQEKVFPIGSVSPKEITAEIPLNEIMSREKPTSAVINLENHFDVPDSKERESNTVPTENGTAGESSMQQRPIDNSVVDHTDQSGNFVREGSTCRKHSSARTDDKTKSLISRPKLCESCTVSMLSYIAMLRDMLDEVTSEITTSQEDQPVQCAECVKERVIQKNQIREAHAEHASKKGALQRPHDLPLSQITGQIPVDDHAALTDGAVVMNGTDESYPQRNILVGQQQQRTENLPVHERPLSMQVDGRTASVPHKGIQGMETSSQRLVENQPAFAQSMTDGSKPHGDYEGRTNLDAAKKYIPVEQSGPYRRSTGGTIPFDTSQQVPRNYPFEGESHVMDHSETPAYVSSQNGTFFSDTSKESGVVPTPHPAASDQTSSWQQDHGREVPRASAHEDFHSQTSPFLRDREESDGILSALSNEEREVYDSARGGAGWERMTDSQEYRDTSFGPSSTQEAFVTMATTNAEALSCLVLGSSLLLCRTTRTLCVLVTDGVSPSLRAPLTSVFQVVQSVRSLDTVGTTKVALLDQPDLGIFFRKLHVWRLVQFSKCVFLNPDTLVIQNSDELFCHEELSAVPDIGWPDCFNSGVFVFQPAVETFWKLVEFAETEGSYDGGDQGLLNAFFKTWSKDIHKKLSFIYNLMANVSYTYTPAFKQFGRNVKIVQFQGPFKPWHVKFYTGTGQIAPSTAVHPTYVQFVHVWLNILRVRVLPLFPQDIQSFASSQNIISASELLKFYPSPIEIEADFLLTPPSVRLRLDPLGTPKQPSIMRRHSIGSDKELKRDQPPSQFDVNIAKEDSSSEGLPSSDKMDESLTPGDDTSHRKDEDNLDVGESLPPPLGEEEPLVPAEERPPSSAPEELEADKKDVSAEGTEDDGSRRSSIPGSEIGDYHGMAAWEQGRMDYMGSACSENIIKRLHFLMDKPSDDEKPE